MSPYSCPVPAIRWASCCQTVPALQLSTLKSPGRSEQCSPDHFEKETIHKIRKTVQRSDDDLRNLGVQKLLKNLILLDLASTRLGTILVPSEPDMKEGSIDIIDESFIKQSVEHAFSSKASTIYKRACALCRFTSWQRNSFGHASPFRLAEAYENLRSLERCWGDEFDRVQWLNSLVVMFRPSQFVTSVLWARPNAPLWATEIG